LLPVFISLLAQETIRSKQIFQFTRQRDGDDNIKQYPDDVVPVFRSTEQSFVISKNMNYGKASMPAGTDVSLVKNPKDLERHFC